MLSDASIRVAPTLTTAKKDEEELKIEEGLKIVVVDSKVVKLRSQDEDADA